MTSAAAAPSLRAGGQLARADLCLLRLTGRDRRAFLQRLLSNDLRGLATGQGAPTALLTPKSQVLFTADVLVEDDVVWLVVPSIVRDDACAAVDRYIVADDVELAVSDHCCVGVYGTRLAADPLLGGVAALPPYAHRRVELAGTACWAVADDALGEPGLQLWIPPLHRAALEAALAAAGWPAVDAEAFELARIEAGTPRFGAELGPEHLLLEAGQLGRVSFDKGCYIGQEPVCRIHSRGQVARRLVGLRLHGTAERRPAAGEALSHADKAAAGVLTSVAPSSARGELIALAYVHRKAAAPGSRLTLAGGGEAEVVSLPFVALSRPARTLPRYKEDATLAADEG